MKDFGRKPPGDRRETKHLSLEDDAAWAEELGEGDVLGHMIGDGDRASFDLTAALAGRLEDDAAGPFGYTAERLETLQAGYRRGMTRALSWDDSRLGVEIESKPGLMDVSCDFPDGRIGVVNKERTVADVARAVRLMALHRVGLGQAPAKVRRELLALVWCRFPPGGRVDLKPDRTPYLGRDGKPIRDHHGDDFDEAIEEAVGRGIDAATGRT